MVGLSEFDFVNYVKQLDSDFLQKPNYEHISLGLIGCCAKVADWQRFYLMGATTDKAALAEAISDLLLVLGAIARLLDLPIVNRRPAKLSMEGQCQALARYCGQIAYDLPRYDERSYDGLNYPATDPCRASNTTMIESSVRRLHAIALCYGIDIQQIVKHKPKPPYQLLQIRPTLP